MTEQELREALEHQFGGEDGGVYYEQYVPVYIKATAILYKLSPLLNEMIEAREKADKSVLGPLYDYNFADTAANNITKIKAIIGGDDADIYGV